MESGRIFFDPACHGNMLFLGNADPVFRGKKKPFFPHTKVNLQPVTVSTDHMIFPSQFLPYLSFPQESWPSWLYPIVKDDQIYLRWT